MNLWRNKLPKRIDAKTTMMPREMQLAVLTKDNEITSRLLNKHSKLKKEMQLLREKPKWRHSAEHRVKPRKEGTKSSAKKKNECMKWTSRGRRENVNRKLKNSD
jgi:hypothetical protein